MIAAVGVKFSMEVFMGNKLHNQEILKKLYLIKKFVKKTSMLPSYHHRDVLMFTKVKFKWTINEEFDVHQFMKKSK